MTDTPQHIKDLQLKIWLTKQPMERLRQFLVDNDALFKFWKSVQLNSEKEEDKDRQQQLEV
jgi:hypothetical protein